MSEINSNIILQPVTATIVSSQIPINFTPNSIGLNLYTNGPATTGNSNSGQILYNLSNGIAGVANTQVSNGNIRFTNIANLKINGGSNAYFLQTDGTGNLTWAPGTANITGNGTSAGANTQIQFSNGSGGFEASAGFTFNKVSNVLNVPGNITSTGDINATGNITGSNVTGNLYGNGYNISYINGSNVVGWLGNAIYALTAGGINAPISNLQIFGGSNGQTITTNGNGTLSWSNVTFGTLSNGSSNINIPIANGNIQFTVGGVSNITELSSTIFRTSNIVLNLDSNITYTGGPIRIFGTTSGVYLNAGNSLVRTGRILINYFVPNTSNTTNCIGIGSSVTNSQPLGSGAIAIGYGATAWTTNGIAIGSSSFASDANTVSIGPGAGNGGAPWKERSINLGWNAGISQSIPPNVAKTTDSVAIGSGSGRNQWDGAVAVGGFAGGQEQNFYTVAIGSYAGQKQALGAVAIGGLAGYGGPNTGNIASNTQGSNSIVIGHRAGFNTTHNGAIILNATGSGVDSTQANSLFIKPIRNDIAGNTLLNYNSTTGEITYSSLQGVTGQLQFNNNGVLNGISGVTYDGSKLNLGNIANIQISGGNNGFFLQTDGAGNLSWAQGGGGGGNGTPGGSNTQIQFNDGGSFGGNSQFTFNKTTGILTAPLFSGNANNLSNINAGNVIGTVANATYADSTDFAHNANFVIQGDQTNITSIGTLTQLSVSGNANINNNILKKYNETVVNVGNISGVVQPNVSQGSIFQYTLTGNITLSNLLNPVAGTSVTVILTQDNVGNRRLTSSMKFMSGFKTLSTPANSIDIIGIFYDGTTYYASLTNNYS